MAGGARYRQSCKDHVGYLLADPGTKLDYLSEREIREHTKGGMMGQGAWG